MIAELIKTIEERYEADFPRWAAYSWATLAKQAFEELKARLESGEVSWDYPFFPFYSLVEWDWEAWKKAEVWSGLSFEKFSSIYTEETKPEALPAYLMATIHQEFMRRATLGVKRINSTGGRFYLHVEEFPEEYAPPIVQALLDEMKARTEIPDEPVNLPALLMKPFRFGIKGLAERFPEDLATRILIEFIKLAGKTENAAAADTEAPPVDALVEDVLSFRYENLETGQVLDINALVEVSPVFLEPEEKRASFPVVVGLEALADGDPVSLAALSPEAHETLWTLIFGILDRVLSIGETLHEELVAGLVPDPGMEEGRAAPPARLILDGPTREDSLVRSQLSRMNKVKLPRKWEKIPRWEALEQKRLDELVAEYGPEEAQKLGLLKIKRSGRRDGPKEETYELSKAEHERLRDSLDGKVFREERNDPGRGNCLAIVKRIKGPEGVLEVSFSWYGMDWKIIEGGRLIMEEALVSVLKKDEEKLLPELKLTSHERERLINQIEHIAFLRDSERLMGLLVDRFGQVGKNVFNIPLWELKAFFECEADPHALDRINGAFFCLTKLEFVQKFHGRNKRDGATGYGPFLVYYELPEGRDGDVIVEVSSWAIGALRVFEVNRRAFPYKVDEKRLEDPNAKPTGEIVDYEFSRKMEREKRKNLSQELKKHRTRVAHKDTAVNAHLVNALARGNEKRKDKIHRLLDFMATELTRNRDPRRDKKTPDKTLSGHRPRLYDRSFCPLLEDRRLAGALAHQKHNPESGRKLYGGSPLATPTSGASPEGLLSVLNYHNSTKAGRLKEIREALTIMKEIVQDTLDGLVALRNGDEWLKVEDALAGVEDLPAVARSYRVHLFFPEDYVDRLHNHYAAYQEERARAQGLPYRVAITRDAGLHRKNNLDRPASFRIEDSGSVIKVEARPSGSDRLENRLETVTPLHERLADTRAARNLTQKELGLIFGVSDRTVKKWEAYTHGELGKVIKGRPIPRELVPLVERWIKDKHAPTAEELASLKSRRPGRSQDDFPDE